jgi:anti-sigma28 factor (negative regulator of flagellin synthesis)
MDISKIGTEALNNEEIKALQAEAALKTASMKKAETKNESEKISDSVGLESFDQLKAAVKESKNPERTKMILALKEKFKAGNLDFDSKKIADAMIQDSALMELLVS